MNLLECVTQHPDGDVAFVQDGQSWTWADVRQRAGDVRAWLRSNGVRAGDRVAIAASSEYQFVYALLGAFGVGAIVVPTNPLSPEPELIRMLGPLEPQVILASPMAAAMADYAAPPAPIMMIADVIPAPEDDLPDTVRPSGDDTALLMMTSGTSGPAKAAMISHANLEWAIRTASTGNSAGVRRSDAVLCALPTAHVFGLMIIATIVEQGARGILQPRFNAATSLDLVAAHQVTILGGAPLMWRRWAQETGDPSRMKSVTRALSGAAPLPLEVFNSVKERFDLEICEGYGLTETSAIASTSLGLNPVKPTSVGQPMDGVTIRLVEPDGSPVDPGDTGEIVIHGPGIFQGYWNDQEATDMVRTPDGWVWTGDAGAFDNDGYLFIVDRLKDVIIVSGFNVYPAEVEEVLREHPDVVGAAVVGVSHEERGETVAAWVVGAADEQALQAWVESHLASYKRPTEFHLVDDLPVTMTGKVMRRELR